MTLPNDIVAFRETLDLSEPPKEWPDALTVLWWDAKGNWDKAHDLADGGSFPIADYLHAYLHRKEGDEWNAGYWYRRAGVPFPKISLEEEFKILVEEILKD